VLGRIGIEQPFGDRRVKRQAQRRERVGGTVATSAAATTAATARSARRTPTTPPYRRTGTRTVKSQPNRSINEP
jgi:hypothetical protein